MHVWCFVLELRDHDRPPAIVTDYAMSRGVSCLLSLVLLAPTLAVTPNRNTFSQPYSFFSNCDLFDSGGNRNLSR